MHAYIHTYIYTQMCIDINICSDAVVQFNVVSCYVCMDVWMGGCMYVYVCMYVCMNVFSCGAHEDCCIGNQGFGTPTCPESPIPLN